ncbi:MAG: hypothetical protein IH595_14970 [Bacteroidales bacterium]|nr:hypothetical protein [Bacteroidales bacterium]
MKKLIFLLGICLPLIMTAQSLEPVWETPRVMQTPESVFYNSQDNLIYVSNINGNPTKKDGNGFISLLNPDGKIIKLKWVQQGLNAPKGMAMKGQYLYVTDIDRLAEIDIRNQKIVNFYPAPGAEFLNDTQTGDNGMIYVTDTKKGAIYILDNNRLYPWIIDPLLKGANGLAWENGKLLVGTDDYLLQVDPTNKTLKKLVPNKGGIDGLVPLGNGKYLVSDWAGKIQIISPNEKSVILSNTTAEKINAADLGYIPGNKLVLIPTFFDNRIIAKQITGL